jgi:hypothetical protein
LCFISFLHSILIINAAWSLPFSNAVLNRYIRIGSSCFSFRVLLMSLVSVSSSRFYKGFFGFSKTNCVDLLGSLTGLLSLCPLTSLNLVELAWFLILSSSSDS